MFLAILLSIDQNSPPLLHGIHLPLRYSYREFQVEMLTSTLGSDDEYFLITHLFKKYRPLVTISVNPISCGSNLILHQEGHARPSPTFRYILSTYFPLPRPFHCYKMLISSVPSNLGFRIRYLSIPTQPVKMLIIESDRFHTML